MLYIYYAVLFVAIVLGCSLGWRSTAGSITVIFTKWGSC